MKNKISSFIGKLQTQVLWYKLVYVYSNLYMLYMFVAGACMTQVISGVSFELLAHILILVLLWVYIWSGYSVLKLKALTREIRLRKLTPTLLRGLFLNFLFGLVLIIVFNLCIYVVVGDFRIAKSILLYVFYNSLRTSMELYKYKGMI